MPGAIGPMEARILAAGRRVPLRVGMAMGASQLRVEDAPLLLRLRAPELALLAEYLHAAPRLAGRWLLDGAKAWGALDALRGFEGTEDQALQRWRALDWTLDDAPSLAAARALLGALVELRAIERSDGKLRATPEKTRDLALPTEDEVRARELFGGTLAFYRACIGGLPEVLRGKPAPIGFEAAFAPLWDGVLGSPEQLLLRRIGLKAVGGAPPRHVLDLACGTGFSTACLAEAWPGAAITAIDFTGAHYPMVEERARLSATALGRPLDLQLGKPWAGWGHELPLPDAAFDAAFFPMNDGFIPPHRRAETYAEMRRVLRPGGVAILVTAPRPTGPSPDHGWELRTQTAIHHAAEFAVRGFQGLAPIEEHERAARDAGFQGVERRFAGLVGLLRSKA